MKDRAKDPERHARRMAAKQKMMHERIALAQKEQGVLLVLTGPGKGKSSSGFGMVARALGHGMKVGVVQFIKGAFSTGEEAFFRNLPGVDYHVMGQGYTWETQNREQDVASATAAWEIVAAMLKDDSYDMILLDELNIALKYEYIDLDRVLDDLQGRPEMQHVVVTGRNAPQELIDLADTVTEMGVVKHAFKDQGIKAQKGVEL
ncbi:cob(I)yrinic acid a,c-diamide adenosyltransferase [Marinobacter sp. M3C]|uniref:cob(I)yrinic acid a,c-diamide adenosyltransferase n=1 Tax=unclassified Marinobacter TaxID=83889 RepID=UPI00200F0890|nr:MULTISPECIES: cob(I)yrinic acid a,c-diamide adenosyltransferase [unclassified Marinobacter]UQG56355.1 cob(I)yrinic acid a,c-diamide adenosyltransferase [Marinobacter sp. M4C]UQG58373.1 cob(I)yrinic acid a,c-diamide adenosyltransferase [Marinobacter sp. M3C]UQG65159.1 cob(I)yrinic acid a,c-diamide adenosyltransferase [Marinobacter sp. M2C]UQG69438.1 cob(I)yrinic acid a,c-diamide adenosyltransferase [Marinobacter sp. M1C]